MNDRPDDSNPQPDILTPGELLRKSVLIYGVMAMIGLTVMRFAHNSLATSFAWPTDLAAGGRLLVIGVVGAGLLLIASYFFEDWFPSYRELKAQVTRLLGPSSVVTALTLSFITAVGEETLFRGALQPVAGIFVASLLFGILHMGRDGLLSAWSLWAFLAGLLLGWMYIATTSLWPCLIAHFLVNTVSILNLRRTYRNLMTISGACVTMRRCGPDHLSEDE
jgi:membrane protease YdiL (CAAX protease family)